MAALAAVLGSARSRVGRSGTITAQRSCRTNGGGQEAQDCKKPEIQSSWDHTEQAAFPPGSCLAQPLLYPPFPTPQLQEAQESAGAIPCCWEIWLPKPQQRQLEMQPLPWAAQQQTPSP